MDFKASAPVISQQCSKTLQSKLQALTDYESQVKGNPFELLKSIQTLSTQYQEKKYAPVMVLEL